MPVKSGEALKSGFPLAIPVRKTSQKYIVFHQISRSRRQTPGLYNARLLEM